MEPETPDPFEQHLEELLNAPFVFWTCPRGCRGRVEWNADCTDARCVECGTTKSEGRHRN